MRSLYNFNSNSRRIKEVRNKASFYDSGQSSRNLVAAEEKMNVKKIQNFNNTSLPIMDNAGDKTTSRGLFTLLEENLRKPRTRSASKSENTPSKDVKQV